ncbi:hypothetical protein [uncultured Fibrella sp.]|uniref:hypothetical protein n=1 Tax=uncultured Fibrella sp. TaxID=1284596 RepID=UPI0035CB53C8
MKRIVAISAFLLYAQLGLGQAKRLSIPLYGSGDTSLWFNWQKEKFSQVGLLDLVTATDSLHVRLSTETQAVDIWTSDLKTFHGSFANFTTRYDPEKIRNPSKKQDRIFSRKVALSPAVAGQIHALIDELTILSIPTSEQIEGWGLGADGNTYLIEQSTPSQYTFKEYWTPSTFKDRLKEAAIIQQFIDELDTRLQMKSSFRTFINTLPKGTYRAGGLMLITSSSR